jgi:hypothetical protein
MKNLLSKSLVEGRHPRVEYSVLSQTEIIYRCDPSREVHVLKLCQGHKNVVKLIEIISDDVSMHA